MQETVDCVFEPNRNPKGVSVLDSAPHTLHRVSFAKESEREDKFRLSIQSRYGFR